MDERLLNHYNNELRHLRETAGEFAREFPKIAGRLALDKDAKEICQDPYVERLLEGFAFLAARVHLKLDAEFPRFTQGLLETVYPHYLAPIPAMAVVRFEPAAQDGALNAGPAIPRGTLLRSVLGKGETTPCTFQTAHAVRLLPLRVAEARYFTRDLAELNLPADLRAKAALRIRLQSTNGAPITDIAIEPLRFFIRGADDLPGLIYEQIFAAQSGLVIQTTTGKPKALGVIPSGAIRRAGFEKDEALLPPSPRSFEGYRLLREYFTFPQRFQFFDLTSIQAAAKTCKADSLDLVITFKSAETRLEGRVDATCLELFCVPVINLFSRSLDRIALSDRFSEFHVVVDRNRPLDFEVYELESVVGYGAMAGQEQAFRPFYLAREADVEGSTFYTTNRVPRVLTAKEKQFGRKSTYAGTEVFLSLVDGDSSPYRPDLKQLGIKALCTNRHLPIQLALGTGRTDFTMDVAAPITAIRCLSGPSLPRPSLAEGRFAWRLISHLSLNYHSLLDAGAEEGAAGLREILKLYADGQDRQTLKQIEGLRSINYRPVTRRVDLPGPAAFARGLEVTLNFDELAFEGASAFLLGAVLERFFAKYVSLNSFTETVIRTQQRGEIMRWPAQMGRRPIL